MDESKLISLVEKYPELYNPEHCRYHDDQRRMEVWEIISKVLKENALDCKDKWTKIRENYRKAIILRKIKGKRPGKVFKPIRYGEELSFVKPYMFTDTDVVTRYSSTKDSDDEFDHSSETTSPSTPRSPELVTIVSVPTISKKGKATEVSTSNTESFHNYSYDRQEQDTIVDLFKNFGKTVSQFPPDLQLRVKRAVFNIVSEAEEELIQRNDSIESLYSMSYCAKQE